MVGSYARVCSGLSIRLFGGADALWDGNGHEKEESESEKRGEQGEGGGVTDPCFDLSEGEDSDGAGEFVCRSPESEELSDSCGRGEESDHRA